MILKALAITALAGLLLAPSAAWQPPVGDGWLRPAGAAEHAAALLLQPACGSLVLLGLVLWLLWRRRAVAVLPLIFVLWVNLDAWFVLGLLLVGLVCLTEMLGLRDPAAPRLPVWLAPACLVGCFVNPHHIFAFRLPDELSPWV